MTLEAGAPLLLASVSEESDDAIRVLLIEDGVIDYEFLTDKLSKQGFLCGQSSRCPLPPAMPTSSSSIVAK